MPASKRFGDASLLTSQEGSFGQSGSSKGASRGGKNQNATTSEVKQLKKFNDEMSTHKSYSGGSPSTQKNNAERIIKGEL